MNEGPFGLTICVNLNSGRAVGMERVMTEDEGRQGSVRPQARSMACGARPAQRGGTWDSEPPRPSGHEGPGGHLRDAERLQSLPLAEICLIEACSFSALTGADGGITIL